MEQEQPATPESAAVVEEVIAPNVFDEPDTDLEPELPEQLPEDDDVEEEVEGVKIRGKKEALDRHKSERLMHADYTRKTQEVAEQRKAFDAERAQHQQVSQTYLREVAQLTNIDDRLGQFAQVNWQALSDQDPAQAQKLYFEYQQLQGNKAHLVGELTQKRQYAAMQEQQETAKQLQEADGYLKREVKGWSPERSNELMVYGLKTGFPEEALRVFTRQVPAFGVALHKANLYDQLMSQRTAKPPVEPPPPVTRVSGAGAQSTKRLSDMSDKEYAASRRAYIQKYR